MRSARDAGPRAVLSVVTLCFFLRPQGIGKQETAIFATGQK